MRVIGAARRLVDRMTRRPKSLEAEALREAVRGLDAADHEDEPAQAAIMIDWQIAEARARYWRGVAEAQLIGPMSRRADPYWDRVRLARDELTRLKAEP